MVNYDVMFLNFEHLIKMKIMKNLTCIYMYVQKKKKNKSKIKMFILGPYNI